MLKKYRCVICTQEASGMGHNPQPAKTEGRCCDECNVMVVIPLRVEALIKEREFLKNGE